MAEAFEIRLRQFLIGARRGDGRIEPDAGHALQHLICDPHARQRAVAGFDGCPGLAAAPSLEGRIARARTRPLWVTLRANGRHTDALAML